MRPQTIPGKQWAPHPGPQTAFLRSRADELLYGGQAGGGKSAGLLIGGVRHIHVPSYRGLILRRTFPELLSSLWDKSHEYYPSLGGVPNEGKFTWRFPSGAKILFRSMEHEKDRLKFKSDEYQYIAFDELTSFTEKQYLYLFSRLRGSVGIPCFMRAASNPGGEGHDWVLRRFAPWLYPPGEYLDEYGGQYAEPGQKLWFRRRDDDGEDIVPARTPHALSRVFIPARLSDNPSNPTYRTRLMNMHRLEREQLLGGNWMAKAAPGEFFQRDWFTIVDRGPESLAVARVRYWDRAATEGEKRNQSVTKKGPDWTVGTLMSRCRDGRFWVEDVVRFQGAPHVVERRIAETAYQDRERWGDGLLICLEEDPGSAGKYEIDQYITRVLQGYNVVGIRPSGDKPTRAKPFAAQAEHGNVRLLRGKWNKVLLDEAEMFPMGKKDQIDTLSGAHKRLSGMTGYTGSTGGEQELAGAQGGF